MACKARTVVVTGATGGQGGSVVSALLASGTAGTKIRAITRDISSEKAKKLASKGIEVHQADLGDRSTLTKAFQGADDLFLNTHEQSAESEIQQGKNAIDAAKEAGIKTVVFSTLEKMPSDVKDALPACNGDMVNPSFEVKAVIEDYLKQSGLAYTLLLPSTFYDNMTHFTVYKKHLDGSYTFGYNMGSGPIAMQARDDVGRNVAAILAEPEKYKGQTIPVVGEHIPYSRLGDVISAVTGKTVKYVEMTHQEWAALPIPWATEMANLFAYVSQYPYYNDMRPLDKRIAKGTTFEEWAPAHREALIKKIDAGCPMSSAA